MRTAVASRGSTCGDSMKSCRRPYLVDPLKPVEIEDEDTEAREHAQK